VLTIRWLVNKSQILYATSISQLWDIVRDGIIRIMYKLSAEGYKMLYIFFFLKSPQNLSIEKL